MKTMILTVAALLKPANVSTGSSATLRDVDQSRHVRVRG